MPILETAAITLDQLRTMTANAAEIRINEQAANQRRMIFIQSYLLKAGSGKTKETVFLNSNERFWWLVHCDLLMKKEVQ